MKDGAFNRKANFLFAVGMSALMGGLVYSLGECVGKIHGYRQGYLCNYDETSKESQKNDEE